MKACVLSCLYLMVLCGSTLAQGGTWVFLKGQTTTNWNDPGSDSAVYGTRGVPALANTPSAVYECTDWIDKQGKFWIFGGVTVFFEGSINDLWRYDPVTNEWTWIAGSRDTMDVGGNYGTKGVPSPTNYPGARGWGANTWTDSHGDLWVLGGQGVDAFGKYGMLNDLWRYNIATNEWTWMSGSDTANAGGVFGNYRQFADTNCPTGRYETTASWIDSSDGLWFFGGGPYPVYYGSNDMWRYKINTNQWAWMNGTLNDDSTPGNYGIEGIESPTNLPPPRIAYCSWQDVSGSFYLFGGRNLRKQYSDVWRYNTTTYNWTWVAGDSAANATGHYGPYCVDNEMTGPLGRYESRSPKLNVKSNVFMLFSGGSNDSVPNDVWTFNSQTLEWHFVAGAVNCPLQFANYGTPGVEAASNSPIEKIGACLWIDSSGILWMFGGSDETSVNELWKFIPDESCTGPIITGINYALTDNEICKGDSAFLNLLNLSGTGITPLTNVSFVDSAHVYFSPDTTTTYTITGKSSIRSADTAVITIYVYTAVPVTITAPNNGSCIPENTPVCAPPAYANYRWSNGQSAQCIVPSQPGNYVVTATDVNGCTAVSNNIAITFGDSSLRPVLSATAICLGDSARITFTGDSGLNISPNSSVTWLNDTTAFLSPDTATLYLLSGFTPCGTYHTESVSLYVLFRSIILQPDSVDLCTGGSVQICAPAGIASYLWSNGDTTSCINVSSAGRYIVTANENGQCIVSSNPVAVALYPALQLSIAVSGNTLTGSGGISYQWLFDSVPITGATSSVYVANASGTYSLQAIDSNGCNASVSKTVTVTGISAELINNSINVFPNPTNTGWQLAVSNDILGSTVEVFDVTGRLVFKSVIENQQSFINCAGNASGVYQLRISWQGYSFVRKLVKM